MRHSRRAVMAEHYKLYLKKNVFNAKYFVRNLQIGICTVAVGALVAGTIAVAHLGQGDDRTTANAEISVKEALFGGVQEDVEITGEADTEEVAVSTTEHLTTEQATTELVRTEVATEEAVQGQEVYAQQENPVSTSEFDGKCIANVEGSLNIRKEPDTDSEFVGSMNAGAIAIVKDTDGEWTKIKSGDVEGYVLTDYILTGQDAEALAAEHVTLVGTVLEDGVNIRTEQSTDADILTVLNKDDTISILGESDDTIDEQTEETTETSNGESKEASIEQTVPNEEADVVEQEGADQKKDAVEQEGADQKKDVAEQANENTEEAGTQQADGSVTISGDGVSAEETVPVLATQQEEETKQVDTEQTAITWIPVMLEDGQTGYVSADLVDVDRLYEVAVSAEELERKAAEEEAARRAAEEEAARQAAEAEAARQAAAQAESSTSGGGSSSSSSDNSSSYSGATTTPVTTTESGECLGTFTITAYCGCSECSGGHNVTASGTTPTEGRTIAADTSI
ncbi:MAG: SH3 domain-containing protein, partial [Lachnospiraceae bacterium]|nr:SH3 domain-containing protein [Lachnospiraceae bacterium]